MRISDLDTPTVICDLDILDRNPAALAAHCRALGIPFRAHTKSHKIPEIAHRQIEDVPQPPRRGGGGRSDRVEVIWLVAGRGNVR